MSKRARSSHNLPESRRREREERRARHSDAALAWLDRAPRWDAGRAVWDGASGPLTPGLAALDRDAARIEELERRPALLARLPGDARARLERRRARLEHARALAALPVAVDLPALAAAARRGDLGACARLADLLAAEALCRAGLPLSPAAALRRAGPFAGPALRAALLSPRTLAPARALAALVLGALGAHVPCLRPAADLGALQPAEAPLLRRAYGLGRSCGLTGAPDLAVAMLAAPEGAALVERTLAAARGAGPFALPPALLRELYHDGVSPAELAALAESALAAAPLLGRLLPAKRGQPGRRSRAERRRHSICAEVAGQLHSCLRAGRDPDLAQLAARLLAQLSDMLRVGEPPLSRAEADILLLPLAAVARLPGRLMRPFLQLLVDGHDRLWLPAAAPSGWSERLQWLRARWEQLGASSAELLARTGDLALARAAFERDLAAALRHPRLAAPALYRWVLAQLGAFGERREYVASCLMRLVARYSDAGAARAAVGQFLAAVLAAPAAHRVDLIGIFCDGPALISTRQARTLSALSRLLPALTAAAGDSLPFWYADLPRALALLERLNPDGAVAMLARALPALVEHFRLAGHPGDYRLRKPLLLAAAVAPRDPEAFVAVVLAVIARDVAETERTVRGAYALAALPGLAALVARTLERQPRRVIALVDLLARAAAFGPPALRRICDLPGPGAGDLSEPALRSAEPGWRELLALAPWAEADAARFLYARWLLGAEMSLPPGVRRALERPARMAAERDYLARRVVAEPARADLAARLANLEAYLAAPTLWPAAGREAGERLAAAADEAGLAAAERLVGESLRASLAAIVGPLPPGLPFDDDLFNAALLIGDVSTGRPQLRRLVRAHVDGEEGWREALPGNAAFLGGLRERGVDVEAWLGDWPAVYPLATLPGGRVRLALERSPLRVLQMGNYFDTCLGLGGCNSFSAVTNAVDLNKRVLYASDLRGRVVGRKLIAISDDGRLLGYHSYTRVGDEAGEADLARLMRRYLADFAARCGLSLASAGQVATLVAAEWYDDGEEAWEEGGVGESPSSGGVEPGSRA